jgi:hypothetical protein
MDDFLKVTDLELHGMYEVYETWRLRDPSSPSTPRIAGVAEATCLKLENAWIITFYFLKDDTPEEIVCGTHGWLFKPARDITLYADMRPTKLGREWMSRV